tara:strand:+ start:4501 stop:4830 length:330 start_codon:yes stop_codon:yes gene_type:complete
MREAVRQAKRSSRDYVDEAGHEKYRKAKLASQDASKSTKDAGLSTEESAKLVEEARDSALSEGQKEVVRRQRNIVFLIIFVIIILMVTVDPAVPNICYYDDAGEYVCQP